MQPVRLRFACSEPNAIAFFGGVMVVPGDPQWVLTT